MNTALSTAVRNTSLLRLLTLAVTLLFCSRLPAQTTLWSGQGSQAGDWYGVSVAAGDVNGDGSTDLVVGVRNAINPSNSLATGAVYVYLGPLFLQSSQYPPLYGELGNDYFGHSVAVGDIDNDGYDDVVVGAYGWDPGSGGDHFGRVYVYSGVTWGMLLHMFTGSSDKDRFGLDLDVAGDTNNDGYKDIIVGASQTTTPGVGFGYARLFSGFSGMELHTWTGSVWGEQLGSSVSGAGDVNGDGFVDVIVGAPQTTLGLGPGFINIYSGFDYSVLCSASGNVVEDRFGSSVGRAEGDYDGDGVPDLLVGAIQECRDGCNPGPGYVQLISAANCSVIKEFQGELVGDQFGTSVAGIQDTNRDGHPDILIGARSASMTAASAGAAYLYSGDLSMGAVLLYKLYGSAQDEQLGIDVSNAGDVNADGHGDFLIGANKYDTTSGLADAGGAWLISLCNAPFNYCRTSANSVGPGAIMGYTGSAAVGVNDFTLTVSGCPAHKSGIFYFGSAQTEIPFGDGFRCVAGELHRLGPPVVTDGAGAASRFVDFTLPPGNVIVAGDTWYFQFWYRDPIGVGYGWNLSDGLCAIFCP